MKEYIAQLLLAAAFVGVGSAISHWAIHQASIITQAVLSGAPLR